MPPPLFFLRISLAAQGIHFRNAFIYLFFISVENATGSLIVIIFKL